MEIGNKVKWRSVNGFSTGIICKFHEDGTILVKREDKDKRLTYVVLSPRQKMEVVDE